MRDEWMNAPEAAAEVGLSPRYLRAKILAGTIPVEAVVMGRTMRIRRGSWQEWRRAAVVNAPA